MAEGNALKCLTEAEVEQFGEEGYLVFEGLLDTDYSERLRADIDQLLVDREKRMGEKKHRQFMGPIVLSYPVLGPLTSDPIIVDRVADLMGTTFHHHHIHATRHDEGQRGSPWHQDYVQIPQSNRSHLMVHVFFYLNGLNGKIGDLLVIPGSQKRVVMGNALREFEYADLPGSVTVDSLAPGSVIIVHSALFHARRPKPGGAGHHRYFIDTSYCQNGIMWPGYPNLEPINAKALELGLDRDGKYDYLYDTSQFFDHREMTKKFASLNRGSLALQVVRD